MEDLQELVILSIAKAVPLDRKNIRPNSTFEELAIDSLDTVGIVFELENAFGIKLPDDFKLSELTDVTSVTRAIKSFVGQGMSGRA